MSPVTELHLTHWIDLLGCAPILPKDFQPKRQYADLLNRSMTAGYLIPATIHNSVVEEWLGYHDFNPNATFYKSWNDLIRAEESGVRYFDQLVHYIANYWLGERVLPNNNPIGKLPLDEVKILEPVSINEFADRMMKILSSPTPLQTVLVKEALDYLSYAKAYGYEINIDSIKNIELCVGLIERLGLQVNDGQLLLRTIIYHITGRLDLVQDRETKYVLDATCISKHEEIREYLSRFTYHDIDILGSVFYRFKPLFMGMRSANHYFVNRVRRAAKKYHKPINPNFWQTCLSNPGYLFATKYIRDHVQELPATTIVKLMMGANYRLMKAGQNAVKMYRIRNRKVWFKKHEAPILSAQNNYLSTALELFENELVRRLTEYRKTNKLKYFYMPEELTVAAPTSQKNFVGHLPNGSSFTATDDFMIGCYWRSEWGAEDYDISAIDIYGSKIGWNSRWSDGKVHYSGDITCGTPEASEVLLFHNYDKPAIVQVNAFYTPGKDPHFRMYLANTTKEAVHVCANYMIDPNDIRMSADIPLKDGQVTLGIVEGKRIWLTNAVTGNMRVSGVRAKFNESETIQPFIDNCSSRVDLRKLLLKAGYKAAEDIDLIPKKNLIDFRNEESASILLEMFA